jgi:hypothetical protein
LVGSPPLFGRQLSFQQLLPSRIDLKRHRPNVNSLARKVDLIARFWPIEFHDCRAATEGTKGEVYRTCFDAAASYRWAVKPAQIVAA